jgi:catechol 2,3-dioxygenase-like lactoylglutathione lyase family enzyme
LVGGRLTRRANAALFAFVRLTLVVVLGMNVQVYGCNHVAIEVDDLAKAQAFYQDVFNLNLKSSDEGQAFFQLGNHQFLAMREVDHLGSPGGWHFGLIVRDEEQLGQVREKVTKKYGLKLISGFRCAFRDPFGNRIDVVDLHDESLAWLLPYQEVQEAGIRFGN